MNTSYNGSYVAPRAPLRNPFRSGSVMAGQFDTTVHAHLARHRDLARGRGNIIASMFWKGYDGKRALVDRQSLAWACYRAGQFCKRMEATS